MEVSAVSYFVSATTSDIHADLGCSIQALPFLRLPLQVQHQLYQQLLADLSCPPSYSCSSSYVVKSYQDITTNINQIEGETR